MELAKSKTSALLCTPEKGERGQKEEERTGRVYHTFTLLGQHQS